MCDMRTVLITFESDFATDGAVTAKIFFTALKFVGSARYNN